MDDSSESKKTKPKNVLMSMFQKKFKSMEVSPALPNATQQSDRESSPSGSLNTVESQATGMESDSSNADKMLVAKKDQLVRSGEPVESEYNACLTMSVQCLRFLLRQGLECCAVSNNWGWDTSNEVNFIELFKIKAEFNDNFRKAVLENALEYYQITTLEVQKNLINACAKATTRLIVQDIGDDYFGILVDWSCDKEYEIQLSVFLRYVDKRGMVIERFLGIVCVNDVTVVSCKAAIDSLLLEHSLSPSKIRGQSYNGGSSFYADINGLKTLVMKETQSAYHFYCFSHELHLALVTVAEKGVDCTGWFFMNLAELLRLVRVSCTRTEFLEDVQAQKVKEAMGACELESEKHVNQEFRSERPYDSCWEYDHFRTLLHVVTMFPMIVEVLVMIGESSSCGECKVKAQIFLYSMESFEFIFVAHLMVHILGCTEVLNRAVQRRDQDIANLISLVYVVKQQFHKMRSDHEWEKLNDKVSSFCVKNDIEVPDMNANYAPVGRKLFEPIINLDHFRDNVYFKLIDLQLQELNNLFDEVNMELLTSMACLNPSNCFSSFDKQKLIRLAELYPSEFSNMDLMVIEYELANFIIDMRTDDRFCNLKDLAELAVKLVDTRKHDVYVYIYLLLKLMLILPVASPSIERTCSAMNYVKETLKSNVGDVLFNASLTTSVERDVFSKVLDEDIISCFISMNVSQE